MAKSSDLFDLIKSLNQTEKRYFKTFSLQYGERNSNNYLKLFDLMDAQTVYKEAAVLAGIKDKTFEKNFPTKKNYLYNLLLKSLRNYHSGKSAKIKIRELYINALILSDRKLNKQAMKLLEKAKKIALHFHLNVEHLTVVLMQRKLNRDFVNKNTLEQADSLLDESQKSMLAFQQKFEVFNYYEKFYFFTRTKNISTEEMKLMFKEFETVTKKHISIENFSFEGENFTHYLNIFYYRHEKDNKKIAEHYKYLIRYYENYPHVIDEDALRYIGLMNNYLNFYFVIKEYDKVWEIISKLEKTNYPNSQIERAALNFLYYSYSIYYLSTEQFQEAANLAPKVLEYLKKSKHHIPDIRKMALYHNYAFAIFMTNDYQKSLDWVDVNLNEFDAKIKPEITMQTKRLQILNHFELNNDILVEHLIRSAQRQYRAGKFKEVICPTLKVLKKILRKPFLKNKILTAHYEEIKDKPIMSDVAEWIKYTLKL